MEDQPTIIFAIDINNWYNNITPISKLNLLDMAIKYATQFYLDTNAKAYILILTKETWDKLTDLEKYKFSILTCRLKEEMEGPMSSIIRERYETTDLFELLTKRATEDSLPISTNLNTETSVI